MRVAWSVMMAAGSAASILLRLETEWVLVHSKLVGTPNMDPAPRSSSPKKKNGMKMKHEELPLPSGSS